MIKPKTKKICIVVSSLGNGGAERSSALLSELLFDLSFEVHLVSVLDKVDYPYKGNLLNLGKLKAKDNSVFGRFKRLLVFKKYIKEHNFDYIIDNRTRIGFLKEFVISKWLYNQRKTIYCVRSYNTNMYINPNRFLGRWLYTSAYKIVTVAHTIADRLEESYDFKNIETIYNFISEGFKIKKNVGENKNNFVLFFGRLEDDVKNISLLLEAYSKSKLSKANIILKILGDGKDKDALKKKVDDLKMTTSVEFIDFQSNPYHIVESAYYTILTSRYEGFPRVLVESLALGTPVVSVDCKSGPSEIIKNEYNGLLVDNHNVDALSEAMDRMIEDKDLYLHCKSNAKTSVAKFSKEKIGLKWKLILK